MWKRCATSDGYINSNYGWMIWSKDNYNQFDHCINKLVDDIHTREACMIYNRPSMQEEYCKDGMHDFCCTYAIQCFLNDNPNPDYDNFSTVLTSNDTITKFLELNSDGTVCVENQSDLSVEDKYKYAQMQIGSMIPWLTKAENILCDILHGKVPEQTITDFETGQ